MPVANGRYMNQIGPGRDWYVSLIRFWAFLSLGGSGLITKEEMRSSSFKSLCYISPLSFLSPPPLLLGFRKRKREKKRFGRKLEEEVEGRRKNENFSRFRSRSSLFHSPRVMSIKHKISTVDKSGQGRCN